MNTAQEIADQSACFDCTNEQQNRSFQTALLNAIAQGFGGVGGGTVNTTAGAQTGTTIAAANADRTRLVIQNQAAAVLYVKLGSGASTVSYHFILAAAGAPANGTGGSMTIEGYTGVVTCAAAATPSWSAYEITA